MLLFFFDLERFHKSNITFITYLFILDSGWNERGFSYIIISFLRVIFFGQTFWDNRY